MLRQVNKPYSESCVQNRDPILSVLREVLVDCHHALEIGSGTGQHAVYFAEALAPLIWQCSDVEEHHAGINAWIDDYSGDNLRRPIALNVTHDAWPKAHFDAIYSANTAHIMSESDVEAMFEGVVRLFRLMPLSFYMALLISMGNTLLRVTNASINTFVRKIPRWVCVISHG